MPYYRCAECGLTSYAAPAYSAARLCPNCAAEMPPEAKLGMMARRGADVTRVLSARPESVSEARHTVVGLPLPQAARDVLALLASELMTNCILHAGLTGDDLVKLDVTTRADRVRLAVQDHGGGFRPPATFRSNGGPLESGGRGLMIVSELADDWGVDLSEGGCTVWCELEVDDLGTESEATGGYIHQFAEHTGVRAPFPARVG